MSLLSDLGERLETERHAEGDMTAYQESRWFVLRIAGKLAQLSRSKELGVARSGGVGYSATWLRSQAQGDHDE